MEYDEANRAAVLNRFLRDYLDDRARGEATPLCDYQVRYPGYEELIASEYTRLRGDEPAAEEPALELSGIAGQLEDMDLAVGDTVGPYRLVALLAEGGFGRVYVAEQELPVRRQVALKVLKLGMDTREIVSRFEIERQTLARMEHPGIARVLDAGATDSGRPYFVTELVDGVHVTEHCASRGVSLVGRVELCIQVCRGIQHAHSKGILHRDIKPSNILVTEVDGGAQVRIIDFGIAKVIGAVDGEQTALTKRGLFLGTPSYMSPEQASGAADIDIRSDVYALGVLLFELLSGVRPFVLDPLEGPLELHRRIREDEPPPPSAAGTAAGLEGPAPRELDWVVLRCLEKDRERRYPTVNELALDLQRFLHHEPVEAAPPGLVYRFGKFFRRHRVPVIASAVAFLALVGGTLGTGLGMVRAARETEQRQFQAGVADAVNHFLVEDLLAGVPTEASGGGAGPDVLVVDLLAAATRELDGASAGRSAHPPLVEAEIRHVLGKAYYRLSYYAEAIEHYRRSAELFAAELGADAPESVVGRFRVAQSLVGLGDHDRALELIAGLETHLQAVSPNLVFEGHATLGLALAGEGRLDEAVEVMGTGLAALEGRPERRSESVLNLIAALAIAQAQRGELDLAEPLFHESAALHIDLLGPEEPRALAAQTNLATFLRQRGKNDEARVLLEELVVLQAQVMGPDHPSTLLTCQSLGSLLCHEREFERAEELLTRAHEGLRARWGDAHPNTLRAEHALSRMHAGRGESERAEELLRHAHEVAASVHGERAHETLTAAKDLGVFLREEGRLDEAEALLWETGETLRRLHGSDDPRVVEIADLLVRIEDERAAQR